MLYYEYNQRVPFLPAVYATDLVGGTLSVWNLNMEERNVSICLGSDL